MRTIGRIIRSVQAFGREFKRSSEPSRGAAPKIGVALSGGFARGIAHIGALKVLEEEHVPIHCLAGTSVGALIGAGYCSGLSARELEEVACRVRFRDFARWTVSRYGFATNDPIVRFLSSFLKVHQFEDLVIPFAVAATDIATGEGVVFRSGPVSDAVRASCAYPGMFLPVKIEGRWLVDGMLAHPVPACPVAEMGATHVIAISLKTTWSLGGVPRHLFDVIGQCFAIAQANNSQPWRSASTLVVEPDVSGFAYDDFSHTSELLEAGEKAMRAAMPEIRKWLVTAASARSTLDPLIMDLPAASAQYPLSSVQLPDESPAA